MAIEEPKFKLIEASGDIELRLYDPMIVAETFVGGLLSEASSVGFRLIAAYIFGAKRDPGQCRIDIVGAREYPL